MRSVLVLAALFALPLAAQAESPEAPEKDELVIEGVDLSRDIPCDGQNIGIYGAENQIDLTGDCGTVIVHGSGHIVTIEQARTVSASGVGHTIFIDAVGSLLVETSGHSVTATMSSDSDPAQVLVSGVDQTLNLTLASPTEIAVDGTQQVVNWSLADGAPEPRIDIGGIGNAVNRAP